MNTQQIPARRSEIRHMFEADEGRILVAMDYSQIELRLLAHEAEESIMIEAVRSGKDLHSVTASVVNNVPYEQIMANKDVDGSPENLMREGAKTVNFGIVYGMTEMALSKNLDITENEAKQIMDDYFAGYPGIKKFMDKQVRKAHTFYHVTDLFGRIRNLDGYINSRNRGEVGYAERQAGNFPIQSGAGVILKKAIVELENNVLGKYDGNIVLQVHDELIFDFPEDVSKEALIEVRETMENIVKLDVPLAVDIDIYPERWADTVSWDEWFGGGNGE